MALSVLVINEAGESLHRGRAKSQSIPGAKILARVIPSIVLSEYS